MIDKSKQYRTWDGREVRIYATDGAGGKVHGAMLTDEGWEHRTWNGAGRIMACEVHNYDLIEVRPRIKRTVWLHLWKNGTVCATEESYYVPTGRIACVQVEIDVEEGEGL